ncbi:head-tail connector protein, partial [Turicimonas muris]|uniref:head-tail connector protein n=4 Tax=Turicimonas muris TaxID=1796652 RepID=UPI0026F3EA6F
LRRKRCLHQPLKMKKILLNRRKRMLDVSTAISAVTLDEAKAYLRVDHDSDDSLIEALALACTQLCEHEILHGIVDRDGTDGFSVDVEHVPQAIKTWILVRLAERYEVREGATSQELKPVPWVDALLDPYRWRV